MTITRGMDGAGGCHMGRLAHCYDMFAFWLDERSIYLFNPQIHFSRPPLAEPSKVILMHRTPRLSILTRI